MAIDDLNVGPQKFEPYTPPEEPPPKSGRGCFFWGCLISSILMVLLIIAIAVSAWIGYRWLNSKAMEYSDPAPMNIPELVMTDEEKAAVYKRWDDFTTSLEADQAATIELNSDELNALLARNEQVAGMVHAQINGDQIEGMVSIPLEKVPLLGSLKGRYFNAKGTFLVSLDGLLDVRLTNAEVKGQPLPKEFTDGISQQNLAKDAYNDPDNAAVLRKFSSIEVADGKITLTAKGAGAGAAEGEPNPIEAAPAPESEATEVTPEPASESTDTEPAPETQAEEKPPAEEESTTDAPPPAFAA